MAPPKAIQGSDSAARHLDFSTSGYGAGAAQRISTPVAFSRDRTQAAAASGSRNSPSTGLDMTALRHHGSCMHRQFHCTVRLRLLGPSMQALTSFRDSNRRKNLDE